ncbi:hypothetical protein V502_02695 [Pseudogymnoascus sp. VKM F-4520 (FW-2644)]|nr:hypothetical protein V502_02695 [Pseudogymnoascus sp. VKM F-4520 (FW-2644)]
MGAMPPAPGSLCPRIRLETVPLNLVRRGKELIGLAVGYRPCQASALLDDPVLILQPMGTVGPGLEKDAVVEVAQLSSRGPPRSSRWLCDIDREENYIESQRVW